MKTGLLLKYEVVYMNFYRGKLTWFNELDEKTTSEQIITFGVTYIDAMERIVKYYGEDSIEKVELEFFYDSDVLPINENLYNDLNTLNLY